jgi:ribonuclease R
VGAIPVKKFSYTDDRRPRRRDGRGDRGGQRRREIEIPEDIHITPRMYQKLTKKIAGTPQERILSYLMLRSLKQARYSEENAGHFALAAPTYTHFTSPIRRYPDLIVHRILKQVLLDSPEDVEYSGQDEVPVGRGTPAALGTPSPWSKRIVQGAGAVKGSREVSKKRKSPASLGMDARRATPQEVIPLEELSGIARESSEAERRADDAERELMEWKKAKFMVEHVGEDFHGLIISVTKFGFFVELTEMFIEGLVPLSSLTDDQYVYYDQTRQIIGQRSRKTYGLGDSVHVLVDRIDPLQHKIQFAVVPEERSKKKKR